MENFDGLFWIMLDFLQICFFILTASEVGRVEIPGANKNVLLVVASFFPSLLYLPPVQSCPSHRAILEKSVQ